MRRRLITPLFLFLLLTATMAQASLLTLATQDLSGTQGTRVGWGYSLYNDSPFDLFVLRIYADGTLFGDRGTSAIGTFRDDIDYNYPGIGLTVMSSETVNGLFPIDGLASFGINAGAPVGASVTGKIYLDYGWYDGNGDYFAGLLTAQYNSQDALASVTVNASAVPEPSTYALLCISLGVIGYARKKMLTREE